MQVVFYKTETGNEPVREWLKSLSRADRKTIGEDIKTVQLGWPLGMPMVRKLDRNLWEVRSTIEKRIDRVLFTMDEDIMVLLHGFIKKSEKTSKNDLKLAQTRKSQLGG